MTSRSTLIERDLISGAAWLACAPQTLQEDFLNDLGDESLLALPWLFEFWALPHQLAPEGDWRTWVIMGGRGAGKTRAGAEWVRSEVEGALPLDPGRSHRVALIGETIDQVREVMVFGESGILACSPPDRRPEWQAGRKRLVWPNGATAQIFSAHDPESLRGPQFDAAWVDELAKWKRAEEAWDMLQFGLRLGDAPRQCVTTTPRNIPILKAILGNKSTVTTTAPTEANRAYLASSFLEEVRTRYAGTRLGRQELDGILLEDTQGAMWTLGTLDQARVEVHGDFDRIVVAVDPPVTGHKDSDECGIVVVGAMTRGAPKDWNAIVLEDATMSGASPQDWAQVALDAMERHGADCLVAEVNQGGDLVESVIRQLDPMVSYKSVRASKGKSARAEPVAALYAQGRVQHFGAFTALEDQMCRMTQQGYEGKGSPDRVDALVWAITDLMIAPNKKMQHPRVRTL